MADSNLAVLNMSAMEAAPLLLGSLIIRNINGQELIGRVVETEAYDQSDAASHSYKGRTPRTDVMFGPSGRAYVYFTYGMHYCFNIVTGPAGHGSAVLIRALEPLHGVDVMMRNRNKRDISQLTNGPAKLCQAFGIDKSMNEHDLTLHPFQSKLTDPIPNDEIIQTTRIGISKDTLRPWRFYIKDNPFVSYTVDSK